MWQESRQGKNDYELIFFPWYWQTEYTAAAENVQLTDEEDELLYSYSQDGLTKENLMWRRSKMGELSNDEEMSKELFCTEYPMSADEAFRNPIENVFISSKHVMRARQNDVESNVGLLIGVDPAVSDNDQTAIIRRRGRKAYRCETFNNLNTMEIAAKVKQLIIEEKPLKVFIDCIGIGAGIVDRLHEMGYMQVIPVNVGDRKSVV